MLVLNGRMHRLSTSNKRKELIFLSGSESINESNSILEKSIYSYLQYHWWPKHLIVIFGSLRLSLIYRIFNEGKAIRIRIIMGEIVQINSMRWPCRRNRLMSLFFVKIKIIKRIIMVIVIITNIVKSWKKIIRSKMGELEFCRLNIHVLIFNKSLILVFFIYES